MREFAYQCIKKSLLPKEKIIEYIELFCARFSVINQDFGLTKDAVKLSNGKAGLFWDSLLVAAMKYKKLDFVFTEGVKDFESLGVNAINPLK